VAIIEMAIVLLLLALLTFGAIEYGWLFYNLSQINNAARDGARYGVVPDVTTAGEITARVTSTLVAAGIPLSAVTINVSNPDPGVGNMVTVEVVVDYDQLKIVGAPLLPTPATLRSSVSMAKEGYEPL
jgi:Flp pilus assembly protein TadG